VGWLDGLEKLRDGERASCNLELIDFGWNVGTCSLSIRRVFGDLVASKGAAPKVAPNTLWKEFAQLESTMKLLIPTIDAMYYGAQCSITVSHKDQKSI